MSDGADERRAALSRIDRGRLPKSLSTEAAGRLKAAVGRPRARAMGTPTSNRCRHEPAAPTISR